MKKGWIIAILFILLLVAAGVIGYKIRKCPNVEPTIQFVKDENYLDSLQRIGELKDSCIEDMKKRLTIYRKQYETKKITVVRVDTISHDSIPAVFLRLADYYGR